ncbi:isocitrate lyase/phosphoenolpyruvate mutase family protein [Candidatus Leptofilum sp.]|uniref:isocitrate lyase/phosphoenolpyruvate mutase family protein n=1 Tax=Candidatus Leptofilum sp. TaxID=3241576 RepID=UPI003B5CB40F
MKTVFVAMSADIFHTGHLNIIKVARELGEVIVGLGTDEVNAKHKQMAFMSYEQRKAILENIKGVARVIPQPSLDLVPNLRMLKPDYVVHGDDWKSGILRQTRQGVIEVLKEWGGQLVEPPYTPGISSTDLRTAVQTANSSPAGRQRHFRRLLQLRPFLRLIAVHNGLSAAVAEQATANEGNKQPQFDALWLSLAAEVQWRGLPNSECLGFSARLLTIQDILACTSKPLLVELNISQPLQQLTYALGVLERLGIAGAILSGSAASTDFLAAIQQAKLTQTSYDFAIIPNLTLVEVASPNGKEDSLKLVEAGADALMLQGSDLVALETFAQYWQQNAPFVPLMMRSSATEPLNTAVLAKLGLRGILYADHLLQAAHDAMRETAVSLLNQSSDNQ